MSQRQVANSSQEIAKTILQQMGGIRRLQVMIGAKNFFSHGPDDGSVAGVSFTFPQPDAGKPNYLRVDLMPSDTYRMRFYYVRKLNRKLTKEYDDIYSDQLGDLFTRTTGLYLRLAAASKQAGLDFSEDIETFWSAQRGLRQKVEETFMAQEQKLYSKWNRIMAKDGIRVVPGFTYLEWGHHGLEGAVRFEAIGDQPVGPSTFEKYGLRAYRDGDHFVVRV